MRHEGRYTPPINFLVDTGSDFCIFDAAIAVDFLGLDVVSRGRPERISGIEKSVEAWVHPVEIYVRDLRRAFHIQEAYFSQLRGLAGVLGHNGFLDRLIVRFSRGKFFEIIEEP